MTPKYQLLDCGDKQKLEMLGQYKVIRPCPQALWPKKNPELWENVDAEFVRTIEEKGFWQWSLPSDKIPATWKMASNDDLIWNVEPNEFGNIGVFVEHWDYIPALKKDLEKGSKILNLFTYYGSNAVALAKAGHFITAVDSSRVALSGYTDNLAKNRVERDGQRIILEDCSVFVAREIRRESQYDLIMIDAPSYGKGTKKEVFRIEDNLVKLLRDAQKLVSDSGQVCVTLHSPRFTPQILINLCLSIFENYKVSCNEILVKSTTGILLPSGFLVRILPK